MKKLHIPRARFSGDPFVNAYKDIDLENTNYIIGSSSKFEKFFKSGEDLDEYLQVLCNISYKSDFNKNIIISTKYMNDYDEPEDIISFDIYNGKSINLKNAVSQISINATDIIIANDLKNIDQNIKNYINENPVIYTKDFELQSTSKEIENMVDESFEESDITYIKTKPLFFSGMFNDSFQISDIQQYLFYIGTSYRNTKYIKLISAKEMISSNDFDPEILDYLSTLEDDIINGKIEININDNIKYRSVSSIKTTLTANAFRLLFKKI